MKKTDIKSEASKFAKSIAPNIVSLKVIEHDNMLSLRLRWKYFPRTKELSHLIYRRYNTENLDQESQEVIMNRIKDEVKKAILHFGRQESDFLISKFKLSDVYEDTYKDKNIMYKVKHEYDRKIGRATVIKNLSFYHFDEIKVSLPHLYYFWILLLKNRFIHNNYGDIFEITYSIIERMKQLSFTYDIIEDTIKEAKHYGNPDTVFVFFYHFSYFVSLIKTIGDNLALILRFYLGLDVKYFHTDLNADKFKSNLRPLTHYYNIVYSSEYYEEYKKLAGLRNIIQHRHIIRDIRGLMMEDGRNKIVIPKDPEQNTSKVKIAEDADSAIRYGLHEYYLLSESEITCDYEDPLIFCRRHIEGISSLTDRIFNKITNEITRILVGEVTDFYPIKNVAVINVSNELKIADEILIEGATTSLQQRNTSMEIDYNKVEKCDSGLVAIKVNGKVRIKDKVYRIPKIDNTSFLGYIL